MRNNIEQFVKEIEHFLTVFAIRLQNQQYIRTFAGSFSKKEIFPNTEPLNH
jgi:hypothetical protein